jgi:hypothetical protein
MWVILGWKPIETRTHNRFKGLVGERVAIHAADRWDPDWVRAVEFLTDEQIRETAKMYDDPKYVGGCVLGSVMVMGHRLLYPTDSRAALIECGEGDRVGLILDGQKPLHMPIMCVGAQGIFNIPDIYP